jgi:hypothetical protein
MRIRRTPHLLARRRSLRTPVAVALAAVLTATGFGGVTARRDAGPGSEAAVPGVACPGLPRGLALIGNGRHGVWRVTRSGATAVAHVRRGVTTKAVRGRDGTIWVEARRAGRPNADWRRIVRIDPGEGRRVSETGDIQLSHVGAVGSRGRRTATTYIDRDRVGRPNEDEYGHIYVELSTGKRRSVGTAVAPETFAATAAPAVRRVGTGTLASVVALGWYVDLTEAFSYERMRGGELRGVFDPTDDAPYGQPPLFAHRSCRPGAESCRGPRVRIGLRSTTGEWGSGSS